MGKDELAVLIEEILIHLGFDTSHEKFAKTPERIASWLLEMTSGLRTPPPELAVFPAPPNPGPVTVRNIRFRSLCSHHFLPFEGTVSVTYLPDKELVGISKVARLVDYFSSVPILQEHFTWEIANWLKNVLSPKSITVRVEAHHTCMACRGVRQEEASVITEVTL